MARCNSCFSILTKTDSKCYVCGDPVPGAPSGARLFLTRLFAKPAPRPAKRVAATDALLHRTGDASNAS